MLRMALRDLDPCAHKNTELHEEHVMHNIHKLRVFKQARENLKTISTVLKTVNNFGDLRNQIQRAAISVVSNIAQGAGSDSNKQFKRFLNIARGSNNECHAQILILFDIGELEEDKRLVNEIEFVGKMLTQLIKQLE